jgi:hypothetical protein
VQAATGIWHFIRADFPADALNHVRHVHVEEPCPRDEFGFGGCPIEEIATGTWSEVSTVLRRELPALEPVAGQGVRIPRRWPLPETVGYE